MRYLTLMVALSVLQGCTPNLLNSPVHLHRVNRNFPSNQKAVLIRTEFRPFSSKEPYPVYKRMLEFTTANAIYNSGKFSQVCLGDKSKECDNSENVLFFDVTIYSGSVRELGFYKGLNCWWFAWPAIYPLPFYYPFQPSQGKITATINVTITDKNNNKLSSIQITRDKDYNIFFYGFLRNKPIEDTARLTYEEMLDEFTQMLIKADFNVEPGNTL